MVKNNLKITSRPVQWRTEGGNARTTKGDDAGTSEGRRQCNDIVEPKMPTNAAQHTVFPSENNKKKQAYAREYGRGAPPLEGESPWQTQNINKGSARAKPKGTATKSRRSRRLAAMPPSPPSARATRVRKRTVNRQIIGSKCSSVKQASRKRIATLMCIQKELDATATAPTLDEQTATKTRNKTTNTPQFS